ncbi:MAG: rhomboid family intramembrane serine protease [Gammaproteobacteria bacterium]|jgi:membrane associated rhomboid family serine protease|nr:rhomboid family intramembrane serine protease [Gammaproteobacteria bacterium]
MIPLHDDNPTETVPLFTVGLIAACVAVFLWQLGLGEEGGIRALYSFGLVPAVLFDHVELPEALARVPASATLFTSMFMHGGWAHLLGNLLYLWIFGNNIEDRFGHLRFLLFYLLCGVAAALAQALPDTASQVPMVGASGAISGVLGAYLLLFPQARVLVVIPIGLYPYTVRLPALVVLGFWFLLQLVSQLASEPGQGGVAFRAHIGGFVAGMALLPVFLLSRRRR